jgi:DNA-binding transcriptional ArsR family regulator
MVERRDVFQGIADPTRRIIIQKLSARSLNIAQINKDLEIRRQEVAKHNKILNEWGMITIK